jgi:outer membrane receptor protein involved in Fe transport
VFDQKKNVPVGNGGTSFSHANIRGVEIELNYQPTRNLWATASYSYIDTTLDSPAPFYNYPAEPGLNVDGAGAYAVFAPGQKFQDPGVPQQLFNFLGNYKFNDGIGLRFGLQVTGPIETTTSGYLSSYAFAPAGAVSANGYYQSPIIPWQYTMNTAIFYEWSHYSATFSVYNLTNRLNWQAAPPYYGNDFLVRNDPLTVEFRLQAKFR